MPQNSSQNFLQNLAKLQALAPLHAQISPAFSTPIFFVGGCVRDLLLDLTDAPTDLDLTAPLDPDAARQTISQKFPSHFSTEKFGTTTFFLDEARAVQAELTPFREESGYADHRHPDQITRSRSLLADSRRRDFRINGFYLTFADLPKISPQNPQTFSPDDPLATLELLQNSGALFFPATATLLLRDDALISQIFPSDAPFFAPEALTKILAEIPHARSQNPAPEISKISILVDPQHGCEDLFAHKIQAIGDPAARFAEDALRIVRAARFAAVLNRKLRQKSKLSPAKNLEKNSEKNLEKNSQISPTKFTSFDFGSETRRELKKNYFLVREISRERLRDESRKAFSDGDPFTFVALLDELNLLKRIFPAVAAIKNIEQPVRYHPFDVFAHTLLVLESARDLSPDPAVRLAALYHDVGKKDQYYAHTLGLTRDEIRQTFGTRINHHSSGPDFVEQDLKNLHFPRRTIESVQRLVANHNKPGEILFAARDQRPKKLRKLVSQAGYEMTQNLILLAIADRSGQKNPLQNSADFSDLDELSAELHALQNSESQFTKSKLAISGHDLMTEFDLAPGPRLGELLELAFQRVLDDPATRNDRATILDFLRPNL